MLSWKVLSLKVVNLPLACQSEHSLRYYHLGRISDLFSIHRLSSPYGASNREKIQRSLVVRKQLLWEKLKKRTPQKYRFLSKIKLRPPIKIVWMLNFRASTPTLYVKNKMAEASLLPQNSQVANVTTSWIPFAAANYPRTSGTPNGWL